MIFNLDNTIRAGNPVRVYDANGLEWDYCLECDTETGRILRYKTDRDGNFIAGSSGDVLREEVFTAAPLTVVSSKENKC